MATLPEQEGGHRGAVKRRAAVRVLDETRTVIGGNRHGPRDVQNEHKLQYAA